MTGRTEDEEQELEPEVAQGSSAGASATASVSTCGCEVEEEKDDGSAKPPGMTWGKGTTIGSWGEAGIELPPPLAIDDDVCCLPFLFAFLLVDDGILL